jgi:hypothetical protein
MAQTGIHSVELADTDETIARATDPTHDHMGRRIVGSKSEALKQDLPYMVGMVLLLVFLVGALAGFWGR